jgi:hypothetical protein
MENFYKFLQIFTNFYKFLQIFTNFYKFLQIFYNHTIIKLVKINILL